MEKKLPDILDKHTPGLVRFGLGKNEIFAKTDQPFARFHKSFQ
jgi:hypothetical protein